jgi:DNA-binding CsgD family transcriptional regulator
MTDKSDAVLQLWEDGLTINKIVEKTSLNVETVRSYLNKNGITKEQIKERANQVLRELKSIKIK